MDGKGRDGFSEVGARKGGFESRVADVPNDDIAVATGRDESFSVCGESEPRDCRVVFVEEGGGTEKGSLFPKNDGSAIIARGEQADVVVLSEGGDVAVVCRKRASGGGGGGDGP